MKNWLYVITPQQWDVLSEKIDKKMMISFYETKPISKKDNIIIYIKNNNGFIASCVASSNIQENTRNIKIYDDHNINKNIINISNLVIAERPIKLSKFIEKNKQVYKSAINFSKTMLSGECVVREMDSGSAINISETISGLARSDDEIELDSESYTDSDECDEGDKSDYCAAEYLLKKGDCVPILLVRCLKLTEQMKKNSSSTALCKMIITHYTDCDDCEFTDNNLRMSYKLVGSIQSKNINIYMNPKSMSEKIEEIYTKAFNAYQCAEPYTSSTEEHMNIFHIQDESEYDGALLLEWYKI